MNHSQREKDGENDPTTRSNMAKNFDMLIKRHPIEDARTKKLCPRYFKMTYVGPMMVLMIVVFTTPAIIDLTMIT